MAKKQPKKQPISLKTEMGILGAGIALQTVESYLTVKKRIQDSNYFLEVTLKGGRKITINKTRVEYFTPID